MTRNFRQTRAIRITKCDYVVTDSAENRNIVLFCLHGVLWIRRLSRWTDMISKNLYWSLSGCIRENVDVVGTDSYVFYHADDTLFIIFWLRYEKSGNIGWKRLNRGIFWTKSDCCLDKINLRIFRHESWDLEHTLDNFNRAWSHEWRQINSWMCD